MHDHYHQHEAMMSKMAVFEAFILVLAATVAILYVCAAVRSGRRSKPWPPYRIVFWLLGAACAAAVFAGPLAERAHSDFTAHMLGHLLLGMLAPLLLALAAPMRLLLRTLNVRHARKLSHLLKSRVARFYSHPLTASTLNIGGLAVLYTTPLFTWMHEYFWLYVLVHVHVFAAGYLFTISLIYIDPVAHRVPFKKRAIVLILALGGHKVLSKWIYAHPPAGVARAEAESGAMLMYYGGDVIDAALIALLCWQWYRAARPGRAELAALPKG